MNSLLQPIPYCYKCCILGYSFLTQLAPLICIAGTVRLSAQPKYLNPSYVIVVVTVRMLHCIIIRQWVWAVSASITKKLTRWQSDLSVVRFRNNLALLTLRPLKVRICRLEFSGELCCSWEVMSSGAPQKGMRFRFNLNKSNLKMQDLFSDMIYQLWLAISV